MLPGKVHNIQLVKIQLEERLASESEADVVHLTGGCTRATVSPDLRSRNITYLENDREVLLKSRMRENPKSGFVKGLIVASGQNNAKRRWL